MITIPIKLNEIELQKIDRLVKIGRYKNRSQAIRSFIIDKLENESLISEEIDPELEKRYNEIRDKLKRQTHLAIQITSTKTALELLENDRERM